MKTIIAGSRGITDFRLLQLAVSYSGFNIREVVCGGARGVDALGEQYARLYGLPVKYMPVTSEEWSRLGKRAGMMRNTQMALYAEAAVILWDGISPGTRGMITKARQKHLHLFVVNLFQRTAELHDAGPNVAPVSWPEFFQ